MSSENAGRMETLALRERLRDEYRSRRDPIAEDRLRWRAQTFRHTTHFLPGQTILELGCGDGLFTRTLVRVTRGENPITAVTFQEGPAPEVEGAETLSVKDLPGALAGRRFDFIVGMDLLDQRIAGQPALDRYR